MQGAERDSLLHPVREASYDGCVFRGTERFEIRRRIGAGALGVVYEAYDRERGVTVALKTLRTYTQASLETLKQELTTLADVTHENLVAVHDLHAVGDTHFVTMELIDGDDVRTYVERDPDRLREVSRQLAQGIAALHDAGRVHGDIKPTNALVERNGRVALVDAGVSALRGHIGTAAYAAPEAESTPAADWYAFGVVLYELLTGVLPFDETTAVLYDKAHYDAQPVQERTPDAPADLATLCDQLLARDPAMRPTRTDILEVLRSGERRRWPRHSERAASLVGRRAEMDLLRAAYRDAEARSGSVVYVRGHSGLGKTTLVKAFLRELPADAVVFASRCYAQESVPYKAIDGIVDALARFLATTPDADALLPLDILLLANVFPVLRDVAAVAQAKRRPGPLPEPGELRRRAFAALRELVARIAVLRPVIIAIDDVQWGDVDSAPIIAQLVAPPDTPPIVLVLAFRSEDESTAPLLRVLNERRATLAGPARHVDITLGPLAETDASLLATSLLGRDDPRCAEIVDTARGVPFLVHELALMARDLGGTVGEAVTARIDALPGPARELLRLIAIAVKPTHRDVLADASELPNEELEPMLAALTAARFVRVTADESRFECYHDQIREAVTTRLSADDRRDMHDRLAHALASRDELDHEALVIHWRGALEPARAGEHALVAAGQARASLAFERAAQLYQEALELLHLPDETRRHIVAQLAGALAHAGRSAEAAAAYLEAARGSDGDDALDLERRAASQYLRGGHIDEGLAILDRVLTTVGLCRESRLGSLLWNRMRLRIRGTRVSPMSASTRDLVKLDTLWAAASDLGMVDVIASADFGTRQLLLALSLGEPVRAARGLLTEAMLLAAQGKPERAEALVSSATTLTAKLDNPELPAWVAGARGVCDYQQGRFRGAAEHARAAVRQLREGCSGVVWEVGNVAVQEAWARFYLGELRELTALVDGALEQARHRGNRFDTANFGAGVPSLAWAVVDRVTQGRAEVDHAMDSWSRRGFHLQHYYALIAHASFDLYEGVDALPRVHAAWPALKESHLLRVPSVAIESHHLRGRAAIVADDHTLLAKSLRALDRFGAHPWASAMAALVRAGMEPDRLAEAEQACAKAQMAAFAAAARRQRGVWLRNDAVIEDADRDLTSRGVRAPAAFARMLVPIVRR